MPARKDYSYMIGQKYHSLLVLSIRERIVWEKPMAICLCDCGITRDVHVSLLGIYKSCGCQSVKRGKDNYNYKGGYAEDRLYGIWGGMKTRVYNKNRKYYERYGGRGIKLCEEWHVFTVFQKWALGNGYEEHLTIDRIDYDKDYEPNNCRWITLEMQNRNRSSNFFITHDGKRMCVLDWCESLGVNYEKNRKRMVAHYKEYGEMIKVFL